MRRALLFFLLCLPLGAAPAYLTGFLAELQLSQITPIEGRGIATVRLVRDSAVPRWTGGSVRFEFDPPAAVPEPTSMLLLGSGLAGLVAVRRRRRNRTPRALRD